MLLLVPDFSSCPCCVLLHCIAWLAGWSSHLALCPIAALTHAVYNFCNNIWYVWYAFWHKICYCVTGSFAFIFRSNACLLALWHLHITFMLPCIAQNYLASVLFKSLHPARSSSSFFYFYLRLIKKEFFFFLIYCQVLYHFNSICSLALLISFCNVLFCSSSYHLIFIIRIKTWEDNICSW